MIRTNKRVAIYARYSSDNQRAESIDAQLRAMEEYCRQKHYIIVETYIDEAKSATTDRRPAFQQMISDSSNHIFDLLLVHKLDRFARNRYDSAVYKRELKKNGVTVCSVLENLDDSPESIMMESVLEGMSEYYSQNLAREVMKGLKETALQCKHTGGLPPLGYDVDPVTRRLVINEFEAETVRIIYHMYSLGQGYSAIVDRLHAENRKTKRGQDFIKSSLHSILANPKYAGNYIYNRTAAKSPSGTRNSHLLKDASEIITIEGGCPQIVSTELFQKVQQRLRGNQHYGGRNKAKHNYLLSGKVFCSVCGKRMSGFFRHCGGGKNDYGTYRCTSRRYNCSNKEINQRYLEDYVLTELERLIFSPQAMAILKKNIEAQHTPAELARAEERKAISEAQAENKAALQNLADAIASGRLISDTLVQRFNALEEEKAHLETRLSELASPQANNIVEIDPLLIPSEYAELRKTPASPAFRDFIQSFINRIEVGRYMVRLTLRTGLGIYPELDTTLPIRRESLYRSVFKKSGL